MCDPSTCRCVCQSLASWCFLASAKQDQWMARLCKGVSWTQNSWWNSLIPTAKIVQIPALSVSPPNLQSKQATCFTPCRATWMIAVTFFTAKWDLIFFGAFGWEHRHLARPLVCGMVKRCLFLLMNTVDWSSSGAVTTWVQSSHLSVRLRVLDLAHWSIDKIRRSIEGTCKAPGTITSSGRPLSRKISSLEDE